LPGVEQVLAKAVREAGALALKMQSGITHKHKPDGSYITAADLAVDAFLKDCLSAAFPDYGWLSEETADSDERLSKRRCFIVDPIDGTRSFALGGTAWCVAAALVEDGRVIATCLYRPRLEQFFSAASGSGTFLNGQRLRLSDGEVRGARAMGQQVLTSALQRHGSIHIPANDIPLLARLAMLSNGELDLVVSTGPKAEWDIAPGALLVTEAGGVASGQHGEVLQFNRADHLQPGLVAAAPSRHKEAVKILEST
jgi:myo-inositol-1(or 4)-monophosphatase